MDKRSQRKRSSKPRQPKSEGASGGSARGKIITIELVAFMFLAVYLIGYTVSMLNKPKIGIETVSPGQIDLPRRFNGVVLRSESVTVSEEEGVVIFSYGENEYVRKGSVVCAVRDNESLGTIEKQIESINDSILSKRSVTDDNPAQTEELSRINSKIKTEVNSAIPVFMQNDGSEVYRFKSQLQKDMDARNNILLSNTDDAVSELVGRREAFERELLDGTGTYRADKGGVLSYGVDGFENEFAPANMMDITPEQIEATTDRALTSERNVKAGSPLFKLVSSNVWYLCAFLDNELVLDWTQGSNKLLYFDNNSGVEQLSMRLEVLEPKGEKTYVVFSSSKYLLDFINLRNIEFSLEDDVYKGLKIPNTAIAQKTALMLPYEYIYEFRGSSGVYTEENGSFSFRRVNLLSSKEGTSYILQDFQGITLGTAIYKYEDGQGIPESAYVIDGIKTVQGVYVANSGTADFKQINIVIQNEYYSIIEDSPSAAVKSYDRIVTDAASVSDNQIIR